MEERGSNISRRNTEYLGRNEHQYAYVHLQGETVKRVKTFTYMGSTLAEELDAEVTHRVQSGWKNWKRVSIVLCVSKMKANSNGKLYSTVEIPALMYGADKWALKKEQDNELEVTEMRMLQCTCGVTKMDNIRNIRIRGATKSGKSQIKWKWYLGKFRSSIACAYQMHRFRRHTT